MSILKISLFGSLSVTSTDQADVVVLTPMSANLLAYLLLHRHRVHPRDVLIGLFWGDYQQHRARKCLNTALWRLRRALEPQSRSEGDYIISNFLGDIGFNRDSDFWLDVAEFEHQIDPILSLPVDQVHVKQINSLEAALNLYTGDLMEGCYEDWALRERERLHQRYLAGLMYAMEYYARMNDYARSLDYGRQILVLDPLREDVHRMLIRLYAKSGQRSLALRQYDICRSLMQTEFNLPPMPETKELYAALIHEQQLTQKVAGQVSNAVSRIGARNLGTSQKAVESLIEATLRLEEACQQLRKSISTNQ